MSVIARFEVIPVGEGSMSDAIASALRVLDQFPVSYRTTATDTIIEADSVGQVFAAVQAAHEAIPDERVITAVEVDEDRRRPQDITERVASVQRELGHPPERHQEPAQRSAQQAPVRQPANQPREPVQQAGRPVQEPVQQPGQPIQRPAPQRSQPTGSASAGRQVQERSNGPIPQQDQFE